MFNSYLSPILFTKNTAAPLPGCGMIYEAGTPKFKIRCFSLHFNTGVKYRTLSSSKFRIPSGWISASTTYDSNISGTEWINVEPHTLRTSSSNKL